MEKKVQKNNFRNLKRLQLTKETLHLLESSDLVHVAGGRPSSIDITCCQPR
jgi:hypothetical protein